MIWPRDISEIISSHFLTHSNLPSHSSFLEDPEHAKYNTLLESLKYPWHYSLEHCPDYFMVCFFALCRSQIKDTSFTTISVLQNTVPLAPFFLQAFKIDRYNINFFLLILLPSLVYKLHEGRDHVCSIHHYIPNSYYSTWCTADNSYILKKLINSKNRILAMHDWHAKIIQDIIYTPIYLQLLSASKYLNMNVPEGSSSIGNYDNSSYWVCQNKYKNMQASLVYWFYWRVYTHTYTHIHFRKYPAGYKIMGSPTRR